MKGYKVLSVSRFRGNLVFVLETEQKNKYVALNDFSGYIRMYTEKGVYLGSIPRERLFPRMKDNLHSLIPIILYERT